MLDIDWSTLITALRRSLSVTADADRISRTIASRWDSDRSAVVCQSVRSGLDLVLQCLAWPPGSEILMTAVTIPEMARIVQEHGLVPVAVDVHPGSLAPDLQQLQSRITPQTRAILVAHLFGSRLDLREIAGIAGRQGLGLWEDVAQGYAADGFPGDKHADISFFSFGMIKAQTAIGGAILRFQNSAFAEQCRTLQSHWPEQRTRDYWKKLNRAALLQLLSDHRLFTLLAAAAGYAGADFDQWLSRSTRGFDQSQFFEQLRMRPCGALVDLLNRRLDRQDRNWLVRKTALAEEYCRRLPPQVLLGSEATFPSRWVQPIVSGNPTLLQSRLTNQGFDATRRASQLRVIPVAAAHPQWTTPMAQAWVSQLVYLPLHPALRTEHITAIAATVNEVEG